MNNSSSGSITGICRFKIGDSHEITKMFSTEDVIAFAKLSMDVNPLHIDPEFAAYSIFKKPIVHGMLTASLFSAVIANHLPGSGSIYIKQDLVFLAPVFHGDSITAYVEISSIDFLKHRLSLTTTCTNQAGKKVIEGSAIILNHEIFSTSDPKPEN